MNRALSLSRCYRHPLLEIKDDDRRPHDGVQVGGERESQMTQPLGMLADPTVSGDTMRARWTQVDWHCAFAAHRLSANGALNTAM